MHPSNISKSLQEPSLKRRSIEKNMTGSMRRSNKLNVMEEGKGSQWVTHARHGNHHGDASSLR